MRDHRMLGWGTMANDAATFVRVIQSAVELASDAGYRHDHVRICARGTLSGVALCGTRDGGVFENRFLRVTEVDEQGRVTSHDVYDDRDLERALARFAEIAAAGAENAAFENAASRANHALVGAANARDMARVEGCVSASFVLDDRRRMIRLASGHEDSLAQLRFLMEVPGLHFSTRLVATRDERLALLRSRVEGMVADGGGPSELQEHFDLVEVDAEGRIAANLLFDLEDEEAAYAEIHARWIAGGGAAAAEQPAATRFSTALARRDWDAVAACFAPHFTGRDHRLVGWGTVRGPAEQVRTLQEMIALAPDAQMRLDHLRVDGRGSINGSTWLGTRDGGAFESPFVTVSEHDADGRFVRTDFYDPQHLDRALARLEEIRARERRDALAVAKPNAAAAALDRWTASYEAAFASGDWEPMRALCAPTFVFDDRRRLALVSGGVDFFIASARERAAIGAHPLHTLRRTAGDGVVIQTMLWSGGPSDGRFEIEYLAVGERDASGRLSAIVLFDSDDMRAAQREAWSRWAAIDPGVAPHVEMLLAVAGAWNARDRAALRARIADDVPVVDHRHTGIGRIEGAAAHGDAHAVLWELAPSDAFVEFDSSGLVFDRHGLVVTLRQAGALPDGGASESEYLWLSLVSGGRIERLELFGIDALEAALARFEELCAGRDAVAIPG
jgi:ketosteroid isomerase-like protein